MENLKLMGGIVAVILVAGGSFWGGMQYQAGKTSAPADRAAGQRFGGLGGGGRGQNGSFVNGTILSKDASSITIQMQQGGTRIVLYSGQTQVGKAVVGAATDLAVGQIVSAQGTANSDGSISAQMIQIRPAGIGFGREATSTRSQ